MLSNLENLLFWWFCEDFESQNILIFQSARLFWGLLTPKCSHFLEDPLLILHPNGTFLILWIRWTETLGAMSLSLGVPSPGEARVQALAILRVLGGFRRSMGNIVHDYLMRNLIFLKFTIITNGLLFLSIGDPDLNLDPRCRARKSLRNRRWASLAKIMTKCELSESQ